MEREQKIILHILFWDEKFIPGFINFLEKNFDETYHRLIFCEKIPDYFALNGTNYFYYPNILKKAKELASHLRDAAKIIIHGLWSINFLYVLTINKHLLNKCYWCIWGGDLYKYNLRFKSFKGVKDEFFRKTIIEKIGNIVTPLEGDFKLAKKWYSTKATWRECIMYPSNVFIPPKSIELPPNKRTNILIGNSADPSNNHLEIFSKIRGYASEDIKIYCPLSYGNQDYAQKILKYGFSLFGEKFIPLESLLPYDQYFELLAKVDIGMFNHSRQQGMGNMVSLLGFGKKVYLQSRVSTWEFFQNHGVKVFDIKQVNICLIDEYLAVNNKIKIRNYFSEKNLFSQWQKIFQT